MSQANFTRILIATPLVAALAACGGGEEAADEGETAGSSGGDVPSEITARQANFEAIGDSFKAIRTQLESGEPDLARIATEAANMGEKGAAQADLFPAGTSVDDGFDTEALAIIWEEPEAFVQAATNLGEATAKMVELAESGDAAAVGAHAKELGGTCKACHDKFRLKTD